MRKIILFIACAMLCFSFKNLCSTDIPAGNVYGHWTLANSPYNVTGNITVPQDSLLEIDAGVAVRFQAHFQLHITGRVLAIGTSSNPIIFNATFDWWGIRFYGISASQDSSIFYYCNIQDGNAHGGNNFQYGGAFYIESFSKVRIEQCTITNNKASHGGAFYLYNASPKLFGNTISNNTAVNAYGGGIFCESSSPSINNNVITSNGSNIHCDHASSPDIIGNTITYGEFWGICLENYSNPSIINNIISYNNVGICMSRCAPKIIGNLITYNSGNDYGPGIFCYSNSNPEITNNTIAYNVSNDIGGGICLQSGASPTIKNNILWENSAANNQGNQVCLSTDCSPVFYNCDIQGGSTEFYYNDAPATFSGTYLNNLDSNPLFIDVVSNDFNLQPASPCIDAGIETGITLPLTDLLGNSRVCNGVIEIGAFELCPIGVNDFYLNMIQVIFYPIPSRENMTLEITINDLPKNLQLQFTNLLGKFMKRVLIQSPKTNIPLDGMIPGIYSYQLRSDDNFIRNGKIIIK